MVFPNKFRNLSFVAMDQKILLVEFEGDTWQKCAGERQLFGGAVRL